jgi:Putative esterase
VILRDNPLGDPCVRDVAVYTPPSGRTEGLPLLVQLAGFTGAGWVELQREVPFHETLFQVFDRLVRTGACPEAVLISPDALTTLGGSQYVNSSATGPYADYVVREIVPWAQARFRTGATGVLGQSSGGFGSLHLVAEHPGVFEAVASSAGDMAFDLTYTSDLLKAARELRGYDSVEAFLGRFFEDPSIMKGPGDPVGSTLNALAMSACYSPRPGEPGTFDLPIDIQTAEIDPKVWGRWLAFDPVERLHEERTVASLRRLRSIHLTASRSDEWFLDLSARRWVCRARTLGLEVQHDEFDGGHFDRVPRFEAMYTRMTRTLSETKR